MSDKGKAQLSISNEDEDGMDEFEILQQEDGETDKCSTTSETTNSKDNSEFLNSAAPGSTSTMADIGKGLDGDGGSGSMNVSRYNATPMTGSYSQTPFNSSTIFGAFDSSMIMASDQLRDVVRAENEPNRITLEQINKSLSDIAKEKSNSSELAELIAILKKSLADTKQKLNFAEQSNAEKDAKIAQLEEQLGKLLLEKDELGTTVDNSKVELADKDEIINVLREQSEEQQSIYETRVKVWRQKMDELEATLNRYHDRGEVNNCA